jgi:hypothetical protein
MQKNTVQWVWGVALCLVIFLGSMIMNPSVWHTDDFKAISRATVLNIIAFLVGYSILKPIKTLVFWKFAIYTVTIIGINWFIYSMRRYDWSLPLVGGSYSWFFLVALPFGASIFLNIGFLKYLFGVETRMAILMGVLIGFTNAQSLIVSLPIPSHNDNLIILPD